MLSQMLIELYFAKLAHRMLNKLDSISHAGMSADGSIMLEVK